MTDKTQEELEKFIVHYRVKCDVAWSEYKDKIYTSEDYHKAIEWELNKLTTYINKYYVPKGDLEDPSVSTEVGGNQVDNSVEIFRLRSTTKKYFLMHKHYLDNDRADLKVIAKAFAKTFGISYENMKLKARGASFMIDDSDFYGNSTITTYVETWIYLRWAEIYHKIEYYPSPHLTTVTDLTKNSLDDKTKVISKSQTLPQKELTEQIEIDKKKHPKVLSLCSDRTTEVANDIITQIDELFRNLHNRQYSRIAVDQTIQKLLDIVNQAVNKKVKELEER